jgi:hypothetical protein
MYQKPLFLADLIPAVPSPRDRGYRPRQPLIIRNKKNSPSRYCSAWIEKVRNMNDDRPLHGSLLVELYLRLRDEVDGGEMNLDPNHNKRAKIVMAIFAASEAISDIVAPEAHVRAMLAEPPRPLAA